MAIYYTFYWVYHIFMVFSIQILLWPPFKPCLRALRHRMFRQLSRQEEPEAGELKPEKNWCLHHQKKLNMEPHSIYSITYVYYVWP